MALPCTLSRPAGPDAWWPNNIFNPSASATNPSLPVCDSARLEAGRGREAGGRRCTGRGRQAGGGRPEAEDGLRRRLRAEAEGGIYEAEDGRANHFEDFGRPRGVARDYVPRSPQRVFLLPRHPTARAATTWNGLLACPESPTRPPRGPDRTKLERSLPTRSKSPSGGGPPAKKRPTSSGTLSGPTKE